MTNKQFCMTLVQCSFRSTQTHDTDCVVSLFQISGLRLPPGELEEIVQDCSTARTGSAIENLGSSRYLGVVHSSFGPMILSMDPAPDSPSRGPMHMPMQINRRLSLTAIPVTESHGKPASVFRLPYSRTSHSASSSGSFGNSWTSGFAASRALGWIGDSTMMTRVVNVDAAAEYQAYAAVPCPIIDSSSSRPAGIDGESEMLFPACQRASVVPSACDVPVLSDSQYTPSAESSPMSLLNEETSEEQHFSSCSAVSSQEDIRLHDKRRSLPDMDCGCVQSLQQAAKRRQLRRMDTLMSLQAPSAAQGVADHEVVDPDADVTGVRDATESVSNIIANPVLDQAHEWLQDDPEALSTALRKNPIFGIIAQEHNRDSEQEMRDAGTCGLDPGEFLLSQFVTESTCFGPSGKDKEDEDPVAERFLGQTVDHPLRAMAIAVVQYWVFDYTMTAAIVLSCAAMTVERPSLASDSKTSKVLDTMNLVLNAVFVVELLLKLATYGFKTYWSRTSNKIDALIVILSGLLMAFEDSGLSIFRCDRRTARIPNGCAIAAVKCDGVCTPHGQYVNENNLHMGRCSYMQVSEEPAGYQSFEGGNQIGRMCYARCRFHLCI